MKFTVKLSRWRTGDVGPERTGKGKTRLLNDEGFMCCLGFACLSQNMNKKDIKNIPVPIEVSTTINKSIQGLTTCKGPLKKYSSTVFTHKAIKINDDSRTTVKEKIILLTKLCKRHGHQIRFIK